MRLLRCVPFLVAALACVHPAPARAQAIACCNMHINVGGSWIGMLRPADCQDYFNKAPRAILRQLCNQRASLTCINTARCGELPPGEAEPQNGRAALPHDPERDGLDEGFDGTPPAGEAPRPGGVSPPRLVYLIKVTPSSGKPYTAFTVWIDRDGCPLVLAANNRAADPAAATHLLRGRLLRSGGRVRIEAEASRIGADTTRVTRVAEADGENAAAVAKAARTVLEQLDLVCRR